MICYTEDGRVSFIGHPSMPGSILAQEARMRETCVGDCRDFALALTGDVDAIQYFKKHQNLETAPILDIVHDKRVSRNNRNLEEQIEKSKRAQVQVSDELRRKVVHLLRESVPGTALTMSRLVLPAKATTIGIDRSIHLCAKHWAGVYLRTGGVAIDTKKVKAGNRPTLRFITRLVKVISSDELYVAIYKVTTGRRRHLAKACIRRGHDRVWRVHKYMKQWPWEPKTPKLLEEWSNDR